MRSAYLLCPCLALFGCVLASGQDVTKTIHGIEERYNNIRTLRVNFTEKVTGTGGRRAPQNGTLLLRKPGKMRWEYVMPAGKLFLSDGEFTYDYEPKNNQVLKKRLADADDLKGPFAFLLGKIDFDRDFKEYHTSGDGAIKAIAKSDNLGYSEVTFVAGPDYRIERLSIKGTEGSLFEYSFDSEIKNPELPDSLFKFVKTPGATLIDSTSAKK